MPSPIYKIIGQLIAVRRKALGMKQQTLAHALEISRGSLANIETGKQGVLVHQLYNFASALEISPSDLLPPQPKPPKLKDGPDIPISSDQNLAPNQESQVAQFFSKTINEMQLSESGPANPARQVDTTKPIKKKKEKKHAKAAKG